LDPAPPNASDGPGADLSTRVYDELRAIARARLASQSPGHTLQATALVHEAYLKLRAHPDLLNGDRALFFHAAANAMRQVLVDHARSHARDKRGGSARQRTFADVAELAADHDPDEILALDEAVRRLEEQQPQAARVVQLRFFAGLSVEETAQALGLSARTVKREWQYARAWLFRALA
jgi:RNA polymerase sigma factor (TIGR02999 family)